MQRNVHKLRGGATLLESIIKGLHTTALGTHSFRAPEFVYLLTCSSTTASDSVQSMPRLYHEASPNLIKEMHHQARPWGAATVSHATASGPSLAQRTLSKCLRLLTSHPGGRSAHLHRPPSSRRPATHSLLLPLESLLLRLFFPHWFPHWDRKRL